MLLLKPAPIYILDEVDAALDLSHTQNIGTMLKQQFQKSQFVIVSLKVRKKLLVIDFICAIRMACTKTRPSSTEQNSSTAFQPSPELHLGAKRVPQPRRAKKMMHSPLENVSRTFHQFTEKLHAITATLETLTLSASSLPCTQHIPLMI